VDFGIFDHVDSSGAPAHEFYRDRLALIERYEAAGFYAYHCAEHHLSPIGMVASPNVFLAAIAQRTSRLRFGSLVYALPLYHPLRLIEEICLLDHLSAGRLEIGFGRGSSRAEQRYFGQSYDDAQRLYGESIEIVREAFRRGSVSIAGADESFQDIPLSVAPYQLPHPPIWYGVHSIESAERAGREGLHVVSLDTAVETRGYAEQHRRAWASVSDAAAPRVGISRFIVIDDDDHTARSVAGRAYRRWHASFNHVTARHGDAFTRVRPATFAGMAEQGKAIAGNPETVLAFLADELAESGADYLVGQFAFGDITLAEAGRSVELFAEHVMPALSPAVAATA
jgi:alkanesulfonate monooxygenase SsuD/methylene tetrahydromethanopterin reductase-like flavin-dependent oxidoreductase (luciferase family)